MAYIAKLNRTYSFKGQLVRLEKGKEVDPEFVKLFSATAKIELFEEITEIETEAVKEKTKAKSKKTESETE